MAIQVPNPGTGNGATGDNEFVLWSKVKANFEDQDNAASRLVGISNGNTVEMTSSGIGGFGMGGVAKLLPEGFDIHALEPKCGFFRGTGLANAPTGSTNWWYYIVTAHAQSYITVSAISLYNASDRYLKHKSGNTWGPWYKEYSTGNTTLDSNGAIKPSSPVLQIYADNMTANSDAEKMQATYTKNGIGDYTISGTTGLRSDGWYIVIPNDINGNPKVAVTLDDKDGVITLRTYKRIFSMETFNFVPDLNTPLDIPDGRWIDLRFNELSTIDTPIFEEV